MLRGVISVCIAMILLVEPSATVSARDDATTVGTIVKKTPESITINSSDGVTTFAISKDIKIWRGQHNKSMAALRIGDNVDVVYKSDDTGLVATSITANADRVAGRIIKVESRKIDVQVNDQIRGASGYPKGTQVVLLNGDTKFVDSNRDDMKIGRNIEVIGFRTSALNLDALQITVYKEHRPAGRPQLNNGVR